MNSPRCFLRSLLCLFILLGPAAGVQALTVDPGGGSVSVDYYSSPAMVEGRPAIAYLVNSNFTNSPTEVKYVRATDAAGTAWGTPVTVGTGTFWYSKLSLLMVNGSPAICYLDQVGAKLNFVRATDTTGSAWGEPILLDNGGVAPADFSIEIIDGKPAVIFSNPYEGGLKYLRAGDASGTEWGTPVTAASGGYRELVMKEVEGRPAIVYSGFSSVWYRRANDVAGTMWYEPPVLVAQGQNNAPSFPSMQIVNGRPAVSYVDNTRASVMYSRATDAAGTAWSAPVRVSTPGAASRYSSLAVVNGKPAIGYYGLDGLDLSFEARDLNYAQANDINGASWGPPVTVDSTGDVGTNPSLFAVNGSPALVYNDATRGSLKYTRANSDAAGTRWPPDIRVEEPVDHLIPDGGVKDLGLVTLGSTATVIFTLSNANAGSITLTDVTATIDGPNAADFSVTAPPAATLAGGASTEFTVRYAPLTPGLKTAVLHLLSDAEGTLNSYDITLTANSAPGIAIERPAGTPLPDGGIVSFPSPVPGTLTDLTFTVRNPGGAELNGLVLTLDGPDAGEFSVTAAPAASVPVRGSTSFTVRHTMGPEGGKNAALHLASNVPGSRNPFDLSIAVLTGAPDQSFNPAFVGQIMDVVIQADGKILAAGTQSFSRLLPDGTTDAAFSPVFSGGVVICLAVQKDGKILMGGRFTSVGGHPRPGLARLNPDGSLDEAFAPTLTGDVFCLAVQPDGKILVGGGTFAPPTALLVRFNPDGSRDDTFNPAPDNFVLCLDFQPDGKILIGGAFNHIGATPASQIARLNADGTPDAFAAAFSGNVTALTVQPDGRILAAGGFPGKVARLFASGATDPSLALTVKYVNELVLQADGKLLIAGTLIRSGDIPHPYTARINVDGSLDESFAPNIHGDEDDIWKVVPQADGRAIILGSFNQVGGFDHVFLARLENGAASSLLTAVSSSTVRWLRGGTAAEVRDVTFELNTPGSPDWTLLGTAHRIPGGWELTGLKLPASGTLRARGMAGGSVMEATAAILTPFQLTDLETWRLQYFNTAENTGDAADNADPDHDGLTNFTEFAFGLSPVDRGNSTLPPFGLTGESFTASFTAPAGAKDVLYAAEWSSSMLPGTWTDIPDTGTGDAHVFSAPGGGERIFVRYALKMR